MSRVVDFYRGTHEAYWDADNVIRERRRTPAAPRVAPAFLDLLKAALVALIVIAVLFVDRMSRDQQVALALLFFGWAALFSAVAVRERIR